jgi:diadenosine tetraphosphate (Ap4A) HIT family hydrolase
MVLQRLLKVSFIYLSSCDFCAELAGSTDNLFSELLAGKQISRVIAEKGSLKILPSLGEIIPGHLLIIPTYHVTASTLLTSSDKAILRNIYSQVRKILISANGQPPTAFEHGDPTGREAFSGQCVSHAHIHILPIQVDMLARVHAERPFLLSASLDGDVRVNEPYLSIIEGDGHVHYFSGIGAPRQYLRALYASAVGQHGAEDWYPRIDITRTLERVNKYADLFKNMR